MAIAPPGATLADFTWRISIADVTEDCSFSEFIGVDRKIVVIDGAGMALKIGGVEHVVKPMVPFSFSGDVTTTARLINGPTRDLNVMTRWQCATASVKEYVLEPRTSVSVRVDDDEELVVVMGLGSLAITEQNEQHDLLGITHRPPVRHALSLFDAAYRRGPASIELFGDGIAIVVRIRSVLPLG